MAEQSLTRYRTAHQLLLQHRETHNYRYGSKGHYAKLSPVSFPLIFCEYPVLTSNLDSQRMKCSASSLRTCIAPTPWMSFLRRAIIPFGGERSVNRWLSPFLVRTRSFPKSDKSHHRHYNFLRAITRWWQINNQILGNRRITQSTETVLMPQHLPCYWLPTFKFHTCQVDLKW